MSKIGDSNDFPDMKALKRAAKDKRIREIEGGGMDDGRVFLHLVKDFTFYGTDCRSKSVGNAEEIHHALELIVKS